MSPSINRLRTNSCTFRVHLPCHEKPAKLIVHKIGLDGVIGCGLIPVNHFARLLGLRLELFLAIWTVNNATSFASSEHMMDCREASSSSVGYYHEETALAGSHDGQLDISKLEAYGGPEIMGKSVISSIQFIYVDPNLVLRVVFRRKSQIL